MQNAAGRYVVLLSLLAAVLAVTLVSDTPDANASARWPDDAAALEIAGWNAGQTSSESTNGAVYVSRDYHSLTSDLIATLTISTSPAAKRIYRAGPEVPFLGNGYSVEPVPDSLVPAAADRGALVARRGEDRFLEIHTYGERRGRFDNGAIAWGLNVLDTVVGRPNDYYLARVVVRLDGDDDGQRARLATALADDLFPRIATWYAQP